MGGNKLALMPAECDKLGDVIGADTVGSDIGKRRPPFGVRGPGDHSRVGRVRASDEIFVDEGHLLPEVLRTGGSERRNRIDVTPDLKHAGANRGEDALHISNDAMIERMNGTVRGGLANGAHHQRLDMNSLDLDVHEGALTDRVKHIVEGRNLDIMLEPKSRELRTGHFGNAPKGMILGVNRRIVVNEDLSVTGGVHIELDRVGTKLDSPHEGGDRILGQRLVRAAVGDALRNRAAANWRGQPFPCVVALGTMSAKLMNAVKRGQSALTATAAERLPDEAQ
jgi:hypothetical protein